jgi:broad specificity phosphatase PhoE
MIRSITRREEHEAQEVPLVVFFVRHGNAGGPDINDILGPPLTRLGEHQAERVAERLAKERFTHIYTSDLARAYDTTRAILKFHGNTPYTVTTDIREVMHYNFVKDAHPPKAVLRKALKREWEAINHFAGHLRNGHKPGERVLVVCHGNFIRSILPVLGGRDPKESVIIDINNTAVTVMDIWPSGEAVLKLANCTKHLLPRQVS